jgi:hypothetical protein
VYTNPYCRLLSAISYSCLRVRSLPRNPGLAGRVLPVPYRRPTRALPLSHFQNPTLAQSHFVRAHNVSHDSSTDTHYPALILLSSYPLFWPCFLLTFPTSRSIAQPSTASLTPASTRGIFPRVKIKTFGVRLSAWRWSLVLVEIFNPLALLRPVCDLSAPTWTADGMAPVKIPRIVFG